MTHAALGGPSLRAVHAWLMLLPARVVGTVKRLPIGQMAIIGAVLIAAWFVLAAISTPKEATGRYMRGDAEVRKLLVD